MQNDRPVEDPNLQAGLDECKLVMARRGLAGAVVLVAPEEAAFTYGLHAPWSAIQPFPMSPLGIRIRAVEAEDGKELTHKRVEGAVHTVAQIRDFGERTMEWMDQMLAMLRKAGIPRKSLCDFADFEHRPHGGKPVPGMVGLNLKPRPR